MKLISRQPIFLAKNRKKTKQEVCPLQTNFEKENINSDSVEYDLMIFQESLNFINENKGKSKQDSNRTHLIEQKKPPLGEATNFIQNSMNSCVVSPDLKINHFQNDKVEPFASTGPSFFKQSQCNDRLLYESVHRTKHSFKPNTSIKKHKTSENDKLMIEQHLVNLKNKAKDITNQNASKKQNIGLTQSITQLIDKNSGKQKEDACKIDEQNNDDGIVNYKKLAEQLEQKLSWQIKQKEIMTIRIQNVENQLNSLIQEHEELQKSHSISLSQISSKSNAQMKQIYIQTENQVAENGTQTTQQINVLGDSHVSSTFEQSSNQDWFKKARQYKYDLERQKIHNLNRESEFKITIQNKQIKTRLELEKIEKQLSTLTSKYESKCQQVRDKQSLIQKYLFPKI